MSSYLALQNHAIAWIYESRQAQVGSTDGKDRLHNSLYNEMRWYRMGCKICLPWGVPNIYSPSLRRSPLPLYLRPPMSRSPSPLSLYLCSPTKAQSSAKLQGSRGKKQIFPPHRGKLYLSRICSYMLAPAPCLVADARHREA